ncbi:MAG: pyruvate dehydrogenase (acetyl-transferring) E1 component subunit alpha [Pseudomonadota bacterium]
MATATRRKPAGKTSRASKSSASKTAVGKSRGSAKAKESVEELLAYYRSMLLIRRFEEKAGQLYGMGLIGGFCHLYIGQEAVAVGIQHALKDGDSVITGYRDHGHMLVCGMEASRVMAELTGRIGGYSKGKGGSMHMFARDKGFYGGHGIVGAQVPLGTGLGFAHKYRDDGGVAVVYMGDGAVNQGQVYEAFNMASLWKLPVVYVIENNQYGMGTSVKRASANPELYRRGSAYNIPGEQIDGMDVVAVRAAADEAVAHARKNGPILLEAMTYRYRGHSMSDPAKYRSREEVQETRSERDPIDRLRKRMLDGKMADEDQFKAIDKEIRGIVNEAAAFAQDSPEPKPEELYTDVYVDA